MYPSLNDNRKSVELDQDDINAIQSLYGLPPVKKEMNETTTTKSVTRTTQSSETMQTTTVKRTATLNKPAPNLCEVNFKFHKLLILNKHFYVFFDDWVWVIPLKKQTIPAALQISSFIPLPTISFRNDGFMYQKPNGDIFFIYKNNYYIVDPDSFALKGRYFLTSLGLPSNIKVNGGVNTYTGRSYIFFNNTSCVEIDDYYQRAKSIKYIEEVFSGIPSSIDHVFRYIDGTLYFFKGRMIYEFNEFSGKIIKSYRFSLETTFNIPCQSEGLLQQLKNLLSKIISNKIILAEDED
ncbi:hypothetical protein HHI36_024385 [Cryptolaemus montrouzieri]|uniref:Uncharacterized protein n=1 Tax=Cryptolaemus montrouzieri TaxID=559131 RepID=A0ABD2N114_9CUCU